MSDNLSPRIIEGRTYSYGSAPVGNFQAIVRPDPVAETARYIRYHADGLARAIVDGRAHDVKHYANHLADLIIQARAGAE